MARGFTKRVVLQRSTIDAVILGSIDGLFALAKDVVLEAAKNAPDSPYDPYPAGEGLPKQGGVLAFAKGGKVNGWSQRGNQPAKPRAVRDASKGSGFLVVGGFGFPAHFAELGTIREHARPFLTPALMAKVPDAAPYVAKAVRARLASAPERASVAAEIAARTAP
jgi:hypothetical protein